VSSADDSLGPGLRAARAEVTGEVTDENLGWGEQLEADVEEFVVSDEDDVDEADEPATQVAQVGVPADPVKDYLRQIGRVPLLNAEQGGAGQADRGGPVCRGEAELR
jgi:hypothetical protein